MKKKILALLLCLTMVLSLLPSVAFADGEEDGMTEAVAELLEQPETEEEASEEEVSAPVEEEPEELAEETEEAEEVFEETEEAEEEFLEAPRPRTDAPAAAVAKVTDATGTLVGDGDNFGTEEAPNKVAGYYKTLQAAVAACPVNKNTSDKADNAAAAEAGAVTIEMLSNVLIQSNSSLFSVRTPKRALSPAVTLSVRRTTTTPKPSM